MRKIIAYIILTPIALPVFMLISIVVVTHSIIDWAINEVTT